MLYFIVVNRRELKIKGFFREEIEESVTELTLQARLHLPQKVQL